ncbi:flippase [Mesorhizobium sp. B2-4-17]|uniref:flippase n=1 Tax=Mesorhizobium sp. B2-4-17 TaxID=2589932 RepID=UPI0015E39BD4|nr:flippase [Mesorhizobium sp. B2-4-17]
MIGVIVLIRNTAFNLAGMGAPLIVAVFTIPALIQQLGIEKFGILTLIWAVVSYLGLLDLGLGRTLTLQVSISESRGDAAATARATSTALWIMAGIGVLGGMVLAAFARPVVDLLATVPDADEVVAATMAMACALPAITLTSGFRGLIEARHRFGMLNLIRIPLGVFTFVGPLAAIWIAGPRLDYIAWALTAGRYAALLAHAIVAVQALPGETRTLAFDRTLLRPLFINGGWLTVSNIVSPLMGYADRFIIGGLVSASAVAYYATPYQLATMLGIVPGALSAVLFPTFAGQIGAHSAQSDKLFSASVSILYLALLPVCAALAIFSHEILTVWINAAFADQSALLLSIFAIGMFINCLAKIPFTLVQSAGRARVTAFIHLAEAAPFILVLWLATYYFSATGAAVAWLVRVIIDTALLFWAAAWVVEVKWRSALPHAAVAVAIFSAVLFDSLWMRVAWYFIFLVAWALVGGACIRSVIMSVSASGERIERCN